jgi:hypothetical protein
MVSSEEYGLPVNMLKILNPKKSTPESRLPYLYVVLSSLNLLDKLNAIGGDLYYFSSKESLQFSFTSQLISLDHNMGQFLL